MKTQGDGMDYGRETDRQGAVDRAWVSAGPIRPLRIDGDDAEPHGLRFERKTLHAGGPVMDLGGIYVKLPDSARHDAEIEVAVVREIRFVKPSELALNRPV